MSGYTQSKLVEARSLTILAPYLDERCGSWIVTSKGALAPFVQEAIGDIITNDSGQQMWSVELKAEEEDKYGNFFLETFSNRNLERRGDHAARGINPGWMYKNRADLLFYHFLDCDTLYIIQFFKLLRWAFGHGDTPGRIWAFPEKRQGKYVQLNDTWGRCVPISVIRKEVGFKPVNPKQLPLFEATP